MAASERKSNFAATLTIVLLAILAVATIVTAFLLDDWSRARILASQGHHWKHSSGHQLVSAISRYGDWPELMLAGAAGVLLAWRLRSRRWQRILIAAMVASTLAGALANVSRLTTGRTRPRESPKIAQGWYGPFHNGKLTIGNSKYNSFPSGHTATAVGFAGVILFASPLVGVPALAVALIVAWSRMALGAHHLSDVTVASILALVVAWFTWRFVQQRGDAVEQWVRSKIRKRKSDA